MSSKKNYQIRCEQTKGESTRVYCSNMVKFQKKDSCHKKGMEINFSSTQRSYSLILMGFLCRLISKKAGVLAPVLSNTFYSVTCFL